MEKYKVTVEIEAESPRDALLALNYRRNAVAEVEDDYGFITLVDQSVSEDSDSILIKDVRDRRRGFQPYH